MVLEVTLIDVLPGREGDFVNAYEMARPLVATTPGCRSVRLQRAVESPRRFVLLAEWDSVEAHERNFRRSDRFAQWRALIGGSLAQPPLAEYFTDIQTQRHNPDHDFFAP
ncbi:antibiotic biosynthesis monooxygenase [Actinoplanes philippinensis]|uniref:Heme-degrading monooxygenase HmoA n=1 Tax=Actinoplanes philippinensis TaxID=35752 RepID=A0A1I2BGP8_9ACTN|nr:antibiotic biosynthesis monooxygenase family protein [Actinoplanes philippinensis]GIE75904.1 antibiotic biosynthesis monooxygenase [Actinoplanes philippinensis]SFE55382.1 Heme-degrading monooxygenase HmoA [Actinoplanes philippinensis]